MSNQILTKLKNLAVLFERPWYGSILDNVVTPLVKGEVTVKNRNNIMVDLNEGKYCIRVDQMYMKFDESVVSSEQFMATLREDMKKTVEQIKEAHERFLDAGKKLYLELTDTKDIETALSLSNSFYKDGVNVIATKRVDGMNYKFPFEGRTLETNDPDKLFLFLGSLANVFMTRRGQPDPKWFSENAADDFPF